MSNIEDAVDTSLVVRITYKGQTFGLHYPEVSREDTYEVGQEIGSRIERTLDLLNDGVYSLTEMG